MEALKNCLKIKKQEANITFCFILSSEAHMYQILKQHYLKNKKKSRLVFLPNCQFVITATCSQRIKSILILVLNNFST